MKWIILLLSIGSLFFSLYQEARAFRILILADKILARADSLNKRADVLEKQWGLLDRRIKKQEGLPHGFGH